MKTTRLSRAHPYLAPLVAALALTSGCHSPQSSEPTSTTLTLPKSTTSTTGEVAPVMAPQEKPVPNGIYKKVGHATKNVGSKAVILGDLNGDGVVDAKDVRIAMDIAVHKSKATPRELAAGDMNGDGKITVSEVTAIQRAVDEKTTK